MFKKNFQNFLEKKAFVDRLFPKHICDQPVSLVVEESARWNEPPHKKKALNAFDKNLGFEGVECGGKEFYIASSTQN